MAADLSALARLCGLATALGLALVALLGLDRRLPAPPLGPTAARSADEWSAWLTRLGPAGATMSAIRILAIALAAYLLILVVIEVLGRAAGLPRLLSLGHLLSTPLARQLVGGAAGLGLALSVTALTLGPTGAASADTISMQPTSSAREPSASPDPVMHALGPLDGDAPPEGPTMTTIEDEPPVMQAVDPGPDPTTGTSAAPPTAAVPPAPAPGPSTTTTDPPATVPPATVPPATDPHVTGPRTDDAGAPGPATDVVADRWVIERGDHLWGVARRTLAGAWHRPPTDAETARYLDRLVEANLEVLVVPGDADLVLAGQVFLLPRVPTG